MNKKFGILGLFLATAIGVFQPAVASAQDGDGRRDAYVQQYDRHDRDFDRFAQQDDRRFREDRRFDSRDQCAVRVENYRRPTRTFIQHWGR